MRHLGPNGYPSFSTHNQGFFSRHMRRISSSLPRFGPTADSHYVDKDKFGRGRWPGQNLPLVGRVISIFGRMGRKMKIRLLIGFIVFLCIYIFYHSREFRTTMTLYRECDLGLTESYSSGIPLAESFLGRRW